jgi:hypothetical protein
MICDAEAIMKRKEANPKPVIVDVGREEKKGRGKEGSNG